MILVVSFYKKITILTKQFPLVVCHANVEKNSFPSF